MVGTGVHMSHVGQTDARSLHGFSARAEPVLQTWQPVSNAQQKTASLENIASFVACKQRAKARTRWRLATAIWSEEQLAEAATALETAHHLHLGSLTALQHEDLYSQSATPE